MKRLVIAALIVAGFVGEAGAQQGSTKPEGEMRWALYVTLALAWFDPGETTAGFLTPFRDEINSSEELARAEQLPAESEEQYTGAVTQDPRTDETAVREAIRRQVEDPEDHDSSLIEECLRLTPEQRLQRLTSWVAFVASARPIEGLATGGRD